MLEMHDIRLLMPSTKNLLTKNILKENKKELGEVDRQDWLYLGQYYLHAIK